MVDILNGSGKQEQDRADSLSDTAARAGSTALTKSTMVAAQRVIKAQATGGATPDEVARSVRGLRTDMVLRMALDRDIRMSGEQSSLMIQDALWMGYRDGATNRAAAHSTNDITITVTLDETDRASLIGYPVVGHTALEAAQFLATRLRYAAEAAITTPLTAGVDPGKLIADLNQASIDHGARLGSTVSAAYFAGIQAASKAIGAALVGI